MLRRPREPEVCHLEYEGEVYAWRIEGESVIVRGPRGRPKVAQIGGAEPDEIASLLAHELWSASGG